MFCPKCGAPCQDDDLFCGKCGRKILRQKTSSPAPSAAEAAGAENASGPESEKPQAAGSGGFLKGVSIVNIIISSIGLLFTSAIIIGRNHILFDLMSEPASFLYLYGIIYYGFLMFASILGIRRKDLLNLPKYGIALVWLTIGSFAVPFLTMHAGLETGEFYASMIPFQVMFNWPLRLTFAILYRVAANRLVNKK